MLKCETIAVCVCVQVKAAMLKCENIIGCVCVQVKAAVLRYETISGCVCVQVRTLLAFKGDLCRLCEPDLFMVLLVKVPR